MADILTVDHSGDDTPSHALKIAVARLSTQNLLAKALVKSDHAREKANATTDTQEVSVKAGEETALVMKEKAVETDILLIVLGLLHCTLIQDFNPIEP